MKDLQEPVQDANELAGSEWVRRLARYREPDVARSLFELSVTLAAYFGLWATALLILPHSRLGALAVALLNAPFLVRLFAIQHDCGHGAFLPNRRISDWIGRFLGVLTITPYALWKKAHAVHHASSGNLDKRGMGDVHTMTVAEYEAAGKWGQLKYRIYRHPLILFGVGPIWVFGLANRVPFGFWGESRHWMSAMATNLAIAAVLALVYLLGGWAAILYIYLPTSLVAAIIGVWLFFVQHQFEQTHWERAENWQIHDAALRGSSHYVLPQPLQWLSANIGIHHVHHLYSRIPFYRLPDVLKDYPVLDQAQRLSLRESLGCARLQLWDEESRRLLSFPQLQALRAGG